jgi:hypothetical protein
VSTGSAYAPPSRWWRLGRALRAGLGAAWRGLHRLLSETRFANAVSLAALVTSVGVPLWLARDRRQFELGVAEFINPLGWQARAKPDRLGVIQPDSLGLVYVLLNSGNAPEIVYGAEVRLEYSEARSTARSTRRLGEVRGPVFVKPGDAAVDTLWYAVVRFGQVVRTGREAERPEGRFSQVLRVGVVDPGGVRIVSHEIRLPTQVPVVSMEARPFVQLDP